MVWLTVKKVFNLDRRRCIATLLVLTLTTAFVVYRFGLETLGKLTETQIFKGRSSKPAKAVLTQPEPGEDEKSVSATQLFIGSVGPCELIEDSPCKKCSAREQSELEKECGVSGFVKYRTCILANGTTKASSVPQNCTVSSAEEISQFVFFEVSALSLAVVSTVYVIKRQRQLQEDLQQRVNKMIASS